MWDENSSSRFNDLKFQLWLTLSTIKSAPKMELLAKIFIHVCKRLHIRCFTGFWMCLCCVRDNYLSVNFPTQPFLLPSSLWWFKAFYFSTFPIFHETHTHALQLATKSCWKDAWHLPICSTLNFNVVSEYKESESTWSMYFEEPFYLIKFPYEKVYMIIKMTTFFSIIHICFTLAI